MAKPILETEPHSPNRALVASFLFTDLVGFSKGTAAEQYAAKATLSSILRNNLGALRDADYRLKDTGDGALIAFTANPEHALFMALAIDQDFGRAAADAGFPSNSLRTGVHLGAVKEAIDLEARPNFVGDGINAAKRIMDFAAPGQITASRAFFDAVAGLDAAYASLFTHVGAPDDKHGRAHELYAISPSAAVLERLKVDLGVKPQTIPQRPAAPATTSVSAPAASRNPGDAPASAMSGRWIAVSTAIALGIAAVYVGTRVIDSGAPRGPQPTETVASPPSSAKPAPAATVPSESPAPTVSQPTPETAAPAAAPRVVDAEPAPGPPQPASAAPAAPAKTNVKTKPRAEVNATAPVAGNALPDRNSPRCSRIMEKATLGETLTTEEKKELASSCR